MINICFHGIGSPRRSLEADEDAYWISEDLYARVLDEVVQRRDVTLSFDDSNISDIELGLDGLLQHQLTATFFVIAGRLGQAGSLAAGDLAELRRHGMKIGTHGMEHVPWRSLTYPQRQREFVDARKIIADAAGAPVCEAALPLGRYDRSVLSNLRGLGYHRVYSSDRRRTSANAWLQSRFSIRADDTIESIRSTVLARQPWLHQLKTTAIGVVKQFR
jgi:peptidoglycan/xylan/chitin deacetylase (PgdA/CDA1 family)